LYAEGTILHHTLGNISAITRAGSKELTEYGRIYLKYVKGTIPHRTFVNISVTTREAPYGQASLSQIKL
jgi:hypothetical protein